MRARRTALAILGLLVGLALLDANGTALLVGLGLIAWSLFELTAPVRRRTRSARRLRRGLRRQPDARLARARDPLTLLRATTEHFQRGVFLGLGQSDRTWTTAPPEHSVLVLGPPRSGKTTGVVVPALLSAAGAAVSTSTKRDVFEATAACRSHWGRVWVYDPAGSEPPAPGAAELRWSPVRAERSWDETVVMARAMTDAAKLGSGGDAEFWNERAGKLLAALLYAAGLSGRSIADVRLWVLRHELNRPAAILESHRADLAAQILDGLERAGEKALGSILFTASSVLTAYDSEAALANCARPNFDADAFVRSSDTLYITAAGHLQSGVAPLVVGLLDEIRAAGYRQARRLQRGQAPPVLWALDEVANIAPLKTLPAVVSEGGGQGLQVMACFQDLSQARARWGVAADGFLSLFTNKLVFPGIGDVPTLRALSLLAGTHDRPQTTVTRTWGRGRTYDGVLPTMNTTSGGSVSVTTHREAILTEGDIANIPLGTALLLRTGQWRLLTVEPHFKSRCWLNVKARGPREILPHLVADA